MSTGTLFVTEEWWVNSSPDMGSMSAMVAHLSDYGFEPQEWRMHPASYAALRRDLYQSLDPGRSDSRPFGAPLIVDSTMSESDCRVRIHATTHVLKGDVTA